MEKHENFCALNDFNSEGGRCMIFLSGKSWKANQSEENFYAKRKTKQKEPGTNCKSKQN